MPARPAGAHAASGAAAARDAGAAERPAYFRAISAISPGSYAAAYQAIRAAEAAMVVAPVQHVSGEPAILSGLGIPAALSAYGEFAGDQ